MKEVLDAIKGIDDKMMEQKAAAQKTIEEVKSAFETKIADARKELVEMQKKHDDEIKTLNEKMVADGKTIGEMREEILNIKKKGGKLAAGSQMEKKAAEFIAEAFEEHFEKIKLVGGETKPRIEIKAAQNMTSATNLTGNPLATYMLTPAVRGRRKVNIRDLVPVIPSATGTWKFYRENTPVGQGSLSQQTTHGAAKTQIDYALTEVTVTADYLAAFVRFAKQMAQDLPFLQNFIANELVEDYKRSESSTFIPTLTSAATAGASHTGASVLAEKYIDWIAYILSLDYDPSAIVTDATNWATILKTKPQNYSIPGGVTINADGMVVFAGIPLIPQNNMVAGTTLIGDFSKAAIIQTEGMSVNFYEQDSDNVQRNLITARIEARVGFGILRTDAFIYG